MATVKQLFDSSIKNLQKRVSLKHVHVSLVAKQFRAFIDIKVNVNAKLLILISTVLKPLKQYFRSNNLSVMKTFQYLISSKA